MQRVVLVVFRMGILNFLHFDLQIVNEINIYNEVSNYTQPIS